MPFYSWNCHCKSQGLGETFPRSKHEIVQSTGTGKFLEFVNFLVVVQLIHRPTRTKIS